MVDIIKLTNGILFDASSLPDAGTLRAKKFFIPNNYPSINNIALFNDRVLVAGALGRQFELTKNGANQSFPIGDIDSIEATSVIDIFDKFIAIL